MNIEALPLKNTQTNNFFERFYDDELKLYLNNRNIKSHYNRDLLIQLCSDHIDGVRINEQFYTSRINKYAAVTGCLCGFMSGFIFVIISIIFISVTDLFI